MCVCVCVCRLSFCIRGEQVLGQENGVHPQDVREEPVSGINNTFLMAGYIHLSNYFFGFRLKCNDTTDSTENNIIKSNINLRCNVLK